MKRKVRILTGKWEITFLLLQSLHQSRVSIGDQKQDWCLSPSKWTTNQVMLVYHGQYQLLIPEYQYVLLVLIFILIKWFSVRYFAWTSKVTDNDGHYLYSGRRLYSIWWKTMEACKAERAAHRYGKQSNSGTL